jgi:hypothetical protein
MVSGVTSGSTDSSAPPTPTPTLIRPLTVVSAPTLIPTTPRTLIQSLILTPALTGTLTSTVVLTPATVPTRISASTPNLYLIIVGLTVGIVLLLGLFYSYRLCAAGRRQRSAAAMQGPSETELMSLGRSESGESTITMSHTAL